MTLNENNNRRHVGMRDRGGFGWGIPALLAAVLIIGGLIYMNSDGTTTTASNDTNRPAVTQTGPAGSQTPAQAPTTTPAPATTPKQ